MTTGNDTGRPRWSASEAAKRCGVGRATIQRRLDAGLIPGATKSVEGWSIPIEGLLAAGFTPDRPSPPDGARDHARATDEQVRAADHLAQQVQELRQQLIAAQAETEAERARREAADARRESAEQLAADRAVHIQDLRRMLTSGRPEDPPASGVPVSNVPADVPQPHRRGPLERLVGRFGL